MKPGGPAFQSSDWHCGTAQEYLASGSGRVVLGTDGDKRGRSTVKTARFGLLRWGSVWLQWLAMTLSPHKQPSAVLLLPLK